MIHAIPVPFGIVMTFLCVGVCAILLVAARKQRRWTAELLRDGVRTSGRIVRVETDTFPGKSGRTWHPVVEFEAGGARHQFRQRQGTADEGRYRVGADVAVIHPAKTPAEAEILGAQSTGGGAPLVLASLFGLAALFIGFLTILAL